uniref:Uncharacterized protein n=1 Tax=Haptolina ericina TaxID=156174 RepID=A0A7S3F311_9EUKA
MENAAEEVVDAARQDVRDEGEFVPEEDVGGSATQGDHLMMRKARRQGAAAATPCGAEDSMPPAALSPARKAVTHVTAADTPSACRPTTPNVVILSPMM